MPRQTAGVTGHVVLPSEQFRENLEGYLAPNKRGILRCQPWRTKKMEVEAVKSDRSVRLQYPYTFVPDEVYCPRCDMYFDSMSDYQDHLIIKQFKLPFLKGIRDVQKERDVLNLIEFADGRDQKRMHWKEKSKRYYNQTKLLDEVLDVRDQCRIQRQRQIKGRTRKTFGHARNRSALTDFLKLHRKGTSLLGY